MTTDLAELRRTVEDALAHHLPQQSELAAVLVEAMRYAALGGGKRLRPMLACAACEAVGGALEDALAPACAVEFIHAYSLLHDDLPAMDDDELRHGLPSGHVKFGEATAILAGDALQALAFETLSQAPGARPEVRLRAVQLLAEAAGWRGMVGGQVYDMESENKKLGLSELERLHGAKTGALIKCAVQIGALFGNARLQAEDIVLLSEFAGRMGLAFQVMDDVLDVTASTDTLGKPAGSDSSARKSTYVVLMGVEQARTLAGQLLDEALSLLGRARVEPALLERLARLCVEREF